MRVMRGSDQRAESTEDEERQAHSVAVAQGR